MRAKLLLLPLLMCAAPAFAQVAATADQLPLELTDPATADKLANAMQALSEAFLNLPVGEVQAAVEGRQPTVQEKKRTVRDLGRADNRNFDRDFQRQIANARPMVQQSIKALTSALPTMMQGIQSMEQSLERAVANMPDPTYPKR
jgi:hypothetical protein